MTFETSWRMTSLLRTFSTVLIIAAMAFAIPTPANAFPIVHTVTFTENATTSDSVIAFENGTSTQALTLIQNLSPSFADIGYRFVGWNTLADGGGTSYADGSNYTFDADIMLYAQWIAIPVIHTVTFNENANSADSVAAFETGSSPQPLTTIQNLSPSFVDAGYRFEDWNTLPDGSGTSYADGSVYLFDADIILYAQWIAIPVFHTVTFNENDSSSDLVIAQMSESAATPLTLFANLQPTFTKSGYSFSGWNTMANGSGVNYADASQYSFASDLSLYAQWTPIVVVPIVHTVTFNENDSSSDLVIAQMSESAATPLTLFANLQPTFANNSRQFSGWNTLRDGSGTSYSDGAQFSFNTDLVLYAQWNSAIVVTFSFSANGGSGSVSSLTGLPGSTMELPGQSGLIREGFVMTDWNSKANGTGTKYLVGEAVRVTESTVFYAQWKRHNVAALFSAIGTFKAGSSSLTPALRSQINRVAHTIKSRKYHKVTLFGYTAATGLNSFNVALSRARAAIVASFLRRELVLLKVRGVSVLSTGEGAIAGQSSNAYSRVEVFGF